MPLCPAFTLSIFCESLDRLATLIPTHTFAVLAFLPVVIALFNLVSASKRLDGMQEELKAIKPPPKDLFGTPEAESIRRRLVTISVGGLCLSMIFVIVGAFGGLPGGAGGDFPVSDLGAIANAKSSNKIAGLDGLIYAGYGAYVYTLGLCISRLNSAALTGKFLLISSVRSAIAIILGFVAAATNMFAGLSENQYLFILFFIGLFPSWAMEALRRKASEIFRPTSQGNDALPINMVDGLDDGIADRLSEIGIWDVQHLLASNPFDLAYRTLYPLRRVVDWIDQAIFISYIRRDIAHFRSVGVRGAIDFAALYADAMGAKVKRKTVISNEYRDELQKRAEKVLEILAQKTGLPMEALLVIGRSLYEDAVVTYIWDLWCSKDGRNLSADVL